MSPRAAEQLGWHEGRVHMVRKKTFLKGERAVDSKMKKEKDHDLHRLVVFTDLGVRMQRNLGGRDQAGGGAQDACPRDSWALISGKTHPHWSRSGCMYDRQHRFETVLVGGRPGADSGPPRGTHTPGKRSHGNFSLMRRSRYRRQIF